MSPRSISVSVPADPRYLRVVRMVANRSAAAAGLGYDRIEDLILAIDEAAAQLLHIGKGSIIDGSLSSEADGVHVELGIDAVTDEWPPSGWDSSLAASVLHAVSREVAFENTPERSTVRLVVG